MTCSHLTSSKTDELLDSYQTILRFYFIRANNVVERVQQAALHCFYCKKILSNWPLFACMECVYVACHDDHTVAHKQEKEHNLFVDLSTGEAYCCACGEYVFDPVLDTIRGRINYVNFCGLVRPPAPELVQTLKEFNVTPKRIKFGRVRGMVNVSNYTCYINCIMQVFIHTPAMRDYVFADKHMCHLSNPKKCAVCTLANVFQEYFSDERESICLSGIVYILWNKCFKQFRPNEQQDALDFFTEFLKFLHQDSTTVTTTTTSRGHSSCKCAFHDLFYERTRTNLVCENCKHVFFIDETLDHISLCSLQSNSDLFDCLNETLNKKETSLCSKCKTTGVNVRQVTFRVLPLVLVIQVNRLPNAQNNKKRINKKDSSEFPTELDMSPYVIGSKKSSEDTRQPPSSTYENKYVLYAIVLHEGDQTAGHYFSYVKTKHSWFKCTDETVREVSVSEALQSQGYLLFFHKATYSYKRPKV